MTADLPLRPADPAEVADTLAHALLYDGNRRVHHADDAMARIKCRWSTRNTDLKKLRSDEDPHMGTAKFPAKRENQRFQSGRGLVQTARILVANSAFAQYSPEIRPEAGWIGGFRGRIAPFRFPWPAQRGIRHQYPARFREAGEERQSARPDTEPRNLRGKRRAAPQIKRTVHRSREQVILQRGRDL
jgi:hypothetical protein